MSDGLGRDDADRDEMNAFRSPVQRPGPRRGGGPVAPSNSPGPVDGTAGSATAGFDEVTSERLLRGDTVAGTAAVSLARILDAAAAPATPDELRRADAVFAAYAGRTGKRRGIVSVLFGARTGRLVGVKLAAAVVAATATAGLAVAAGVLPTPLHPGPAASHSYASPKPAPSVAASQRPSPVQSASIAPTVAALCAAYWATGPSQREKALGTPAYAALVAAAGGAERVTAYCGPVAPSATPSHRTTGKPTAHPSHPTTTSKSR